MDTLGRRGFLIRSAASAGGAGLSLALGGRAVASPAVVSRSERRVERVLTGMPTIEGAGVRLERVIGQPALPNLDPFLLLDRFHSDDPDDYIAGFPDHPHRGFETVTVMLAGRMRHRDSRGNAGLITGGGGQWMTAARGIVHSEMPEHGARGGVKVRGLMSGFQLWVNLPAREKMSVPAYQDLPPARISEQRLTSTGSLLRLYAGRVSGSTGPVRPRPTDPLLLTVALEDDQPFLLELPAGHTAFLFVASGEVQVGPENRASTVSAQHLALLGPGTRLRLRATNRRSETLIAAGRPLHEPIVQRGPFVMNTEAEIQRAMADYRAGLLDR